MEDAAYSYEQAGFPVLCSCVRETYPLGHRLCRSSAGRYYRVRPLSLFGRNWSRTQLPCSLPYPGQSCACTVPCPKLFNYKLFSTGIERNIQSEKKCLP